MKIKQLTLTNDYYSSFHIRRDLFPKNNDTWHAHEEFEFIYIYKGFGSLFIGDSIIQFTEGMSVLIGPNIPHYWMFDNFKDNFDDQIDCVVIHFLPDFLGKGFFDLPEMLSIKDLLDNSSKGLLIDDRENKLNPSFIKTLVDKSTTKIISLLALLEMFSTTKYIKLVSDNYATLNAQNDTKRMNNIMTLIRNNYRQDIKLEELADIAKMTKNSFCRYFKQQTGKTVIQFINEIRISQACGLLKNSALTLKEICFEVGFNNFVSFHKVFRKLLNTTPIQYRKTINQTSK